MTRTRDNTPTIKAAETALQKGLQAWILAGLGFMLLPGTFLGAWNLIFIAGEHSPGRMDPAWLQAHGHAQIFGWIGSFVLGIGFYSLTKMAHVPPFAAWRMWLSWHLWTGGVTLRWATNLWRWQWRWMLPTSAAVELAAFLLFFVTVSRHRPAGQNSTSRDLRSIVWMICVTAGSLGFLASLVGNLYVAVQVSIDGIWPAMPHDWNQRLLVLFTWAFPVVTIWGFSARWLPVFLGLPGPSPGLLLAALAINFGAVTAAWAGWWAGATAFFLAGSFSATTAIHIFQVSPKPAKTAGVHSHFPLFIRAAYGWLLVSGLMGLCAAFLDKSGGFWGASRHALTVGFISTMVFAIGQRVLPAFCGMRILYSPALMGWSLWLLAAGCFLRVTAEIGAYESYIPQLWGVLPVSAIVEMTAVTLFALNLLLTLRQPPAHLKTSSEKGTSVATV